MYVVNSVPGFQFDYVFDWIILKHQDPDRQMDPIIRDSVSESDVIKLFCVLLTMSNSLY